MSLLDELVALAERHQNAPEQQRLVLKMALNLLDGLANPGHMRPSRHPFTMEEFMKVPGRWKLSQGRLIDY